MKLRRRTVPLEHKPVAAPIASVTGRSPARPAFETGKQALLTLQTPRAEHLAQSLSFAPTFPQGLALEVRDAKSGAIAFTAGATRSRAREALEAAGVTLLGVRHGQSESNALTQRYGEPVLAGRADAPLTAKGREQAATAAKSFYEELGGPEWLARAVKDPTLLPVLYVSPLQRTHQTADALVRLLRDEGAKLGATIELHPTVDARLIEIDYGDLDLKPLSQFRAAKPDLFQSWEAFQGDGVNYLDGFPNGESRLDVLNRVTPFAEDVAARHPGRTVIAFSHLETMVGLQVATANVSTKSDGTLHVMASRLPNASVLHFSGPQAPGVQDDG